MANRPPEIQPPDDDDLATTEEHGRTPRWWLLLWSGWGLLMSLLVLWLDRHYVASACWLVAGVAIGLFAPRLAVLLQDPVFRWYDRYSRNPAIDDRMMQLVLKDQTDSEEFHRLLGDRMIDEVVFCPPIVGLVHGTFVGAIAGALSDLDPTFPFTAAQGAVLGVLLFIPGAAFLSATVFAAMIPQDKSRPITNRLLRQLRMIVSPLLVVLLVCHLVERLVRGWRGARP
jgi:hypothetical protein